MLQDEMFRHFLQFHVVNFLLKKEEDDIPSTVNCEALGKEKEKLCLDGKSAIQLHLGNVAY